MRFLSKKARAAMRDRRDFYVAAEITFADDTKMTLGKSDFTLSGNTVIDSAESNSFPLGILASKRITISLMNDDDRWSEYDFFGAKIFLQTKFDLDDETTETLNIGTFTVVEPESYGTTVVISAMDDSYKTDRDYSTTMEYPMSLGTALRDSCTTCGITMTGEIPNSSYIIPEAPTDITHRQFIGMCAMIAGGNATFDEYNRLKILTYDFSPFEKVGFDGGIFDKGTPSYKTGDKVDGGLFDPWNTGDTADGGAFGDRNNIHILYEFASGMTIGVDDVIITGVQMDGKDEDNNTVTHLFGSEGYVLALDNRLAAGKEDEALALIGAKIVGLRFRPFSANHVSLPTAEFMDLAVVVDRKQNVYQSVLTDVTFAYFGFTALKCSADSPIRNSSKYYGNETKAIVEARKMVEKEKTARDLAMEQLASELAHSSGLYMTQDVQDDGSIIYYMHDKPTLEESRIVWKLTAEAFGISTDGGQTYPYGLDATGMAILNRIYAIGLDADYITTGAFEIRRNGKIMVLMDKDTGQVILRPDTFELSDGSTIQSIAQDTVNTFDETLTQQEVFDRLTDSGSAKGIYLKNGQLYISATYIQSGAIKIAKNGKETFYADVDTGEVRIVADSFSLSSGKTIESIAEEKAKAQAQQALNDFIDATYDPDLAEMQKQLDGQLETYYYDYEPKTTNAPANGWTTTDQKAAHEGDMFYWKTKGYAYRWTKSGSTYSWVQVKDSDVTSALDKASKAQDTADGKRRTFLSTPTPPYDRGDLWYGGTTADVKVCTTAKSSGSYSSSDWVKYDKYIDQQAAVDAANSAVNTFDQKLNQKEVFNRLTANGTKKGIFLEDGELYVNATYMSTGVLQSADGKTFYLDLDNGILKMEATELTIKGQSVNDALAGAVTSIEQQFYLSSSSTTTTGGSWSSNQPTWTQGKYIWNRQYVTYGNGSHAYLPSSTGVCISGNTGKNGTNGTNGTNGDDGISVTKVEAQYISRLSSLNGGPSDSDSGWSTTMPEVQDYYNIWCRQKITYSDNTTSYTKAYCMTKTMGDIAQQKLDAQTQKDIFNKLTNNGADQGIYLQDGKVYINAQYIVSGIITDKTQTSMWNLDTGEFRSMDKVGTNGFGMSFYKGNLYFGSKSELDKVSDGSSTTSFNTGLIIFRSSSSSSPNWNNIVCRNGELAISSPDGKIYLGYSDEDIYMFHNSKNVYVSGRDLPAYTGPITINGTNRYVIHGMIVEASKVTG